MKTAPGESRIAENHKPPCFNAVYAFRYRSDGFPLLLVARLHLDLLVVATVGRVPGWQCQTSNSVRYDGQGSSCTYFRSFSMRSTCVMTIRRQQYRLQPSWSSASLWIVSVRAGPLCCARRWRLPVAKPLLLDQLHKFLPEIARHLGKELADREVHPDRCVTHLAAGETANRDDHRFGTGRILAIVDTPCGKNPQWSVKLAVALKSLAMIGDGAGCPFDRYLLIELVVKERLHCRRASNLCLGPGLCIALSPIRLPPHCNFFRCLRQNFFRLGAIGAGLDWRLSGFVPLLRSLHSPPRCGQHPR